MSLQTVSEPPPMVTGITKPSRHRVAVVDFPDDEPDSKNVRGVFGDGVTPGDAAAAMELAGRIRDEIGPGSWVVIDQDGKAYTVGDFWRRWYVSGPPGWVHPDHQASADSFAELRAMRDREKAAELAASEAEKAERKKSGVRKGRRKRGGDMIAGG